MSSNTKNHPLLKRSRIIDEWLKPMYYIMIQSNRFNPIFGRTQTTHTHIKKLHTQNAN